MKLKNKVQYLLLWGLLPAFLFFCGCTSELDGGDRGSGGAGVNATLNLSFLPLGSSGAPTRATGQGLDVEFGGVAGSSTRSTDEGTVQNVCVFQFEGSLGSATAVLKSKSYFGSLTGLQLYVPLVGSSNFFIYVCANVGDITTGFTAGSSTYQDLLNASLPITGQADFSSLLPMGGISTATYDTFSLAGDIGVSLSRLVAKVTFTYNLSALPAGDTFTVTDISLKSVPQGTPYVTPSALSTTVDLADYPGTVPNPAQTTYKNTWYMGQNLRGAGGTNGGNVVGTWTDRIAANAPAGSTYIEMKGDYTSDGVIYVATYVLYLGNGTEMNDYNVAANHSYTVTATIKGINIADHRVTLKTYTNLSSDGTSNCYIVSESDKYYSLNGTVRGNGRTTDYAKAQYSELSDGAMFPTALAGASDAVTIPKADISDAVIVWQTAIGLLNGVSWDASVGQVKFTTGSITNGNAVIAVRDASHNILWSWHIWRTNGITLDDMATNAITVQTNVENHDWYTAGGTNHERKLMDRNLGASGTTETGNIGVGCLQYQFGRKDPFVGAANYTTATDQVVYDGSGTSFKFSDAGKLTDVSSIGSTAKSSINYSIQHPESFIKGSSASSYNWISGETASTADWKVSNCLWGDNNISADNVAPTPWNGDKTIYDPCPIGWRVAPTDIWTGVLMNTASGTNAAATGWNGQAVSSTSINQAYHTDNWTANSPYGHTFYFNGNTGTATFCPASGLRYKSSGALSSVGSSGYGWLSAPGGDSSVGGVNLYFGAGNVNVAALFSRAGGMIVRCVQE